MVLNHLQIGLPDRRTKPRTKCNYHTVIQGYDAMKAGFAENGRIVNISSDGAYICLFRPIMVGTEIALTITVPTGSPDNNSLVLRATGTVIRCKMSPNGTYGMALKFISRPQKYDTNENT